MIVSSHIETRNGKHRPSKVVPSRLQISRHHRDPAAIALTLSVPAWPLQNSVAVNPFWNLRERSFSSVMEHLPAILHTKLYMPLDYFLDKFQSGIITQLSLAKALDICKKRLWSGPETVDELLQHSKTDRDVIRACRTFAEYHDYMSSTSWQGFVSKQISKYAAAYFDDGQAIACFPWRGLSFWQAWLSAQEFDCSMGKIGQENCRVHLQDFTNCTASDFIDSALAGLGIKSPVARELYLSRLLASSLGWSTQFSYYQWQKALGHEVTSEAQTLDFLAVLLAYDYVLAQTQSFDDPSVVKSWVGSLRAMTSSDAGKVRAFDLHQVWQMALELSYQAQIASQLEPSKEGRASARFQMVMCIDVRSEIMRRALERASSEIETVGFAGFFGVPFTYLRAEENSAEHRLPVLLPPAFLVSQEARTVESERLACDRIARSFFRNLRKLPLASFFYVEVFGIYALLSMLRDSISALISHRLSRKVPKRFQNHQRGSTFTKVTLAGGGVVDVEAKVERAAMVLNHMGITKKFARLVILTGHGSAQTNNAFQSALDCGACGGHPGDVNARFLADLLNEPGVRMGLALKGIRIPESSWFVAALHETVTDEVYILDKDKVPASYSKDIDELETYLDRASERARAERQAARSIHLDSSAYRRSRNWSEVRPEWGLAGNACFIVAPRSWTKTINLGSRAFLHDYDAATDKGFATLELIMTAPMIVANWINLQYYASTVAPGVYGAGNKVLHNLVNECGVVEGNGGDLRVGLPIQSVHDGKHYVHEPLRLSVFLAAPQQAIEVIIHKHAVVEQLVNNEWLYLLHIDDKTGGVARRLPGGGYEPIPSNEVP